MAGIGFQLNKLFQRKGVLANIQAYLYSTLVTIGPTVICVVIITCINFLLKARGVSLKEIEALQVTIMYSFVFSLILTSGYCIILSRYVSDKLYMKEYEDILPSLYGALAVSLAISGLISFVFYSFSPLQMIYKVFAYLLMLQLVSQSVLSCYVSALKNYKRISFAYVIAFLMGSVMYMLLGRLTSMNQPLICLMSFNLSFLVINSLLLYEVQSYFSKRSNKYFEFLSYFWRYKTIFLTNTFWIMGLYIHNFIFWTVPRMNYVIENTFVYSPSYDIPGFYSFITTLPTLVIFVVKLETAFFAKYSNYFYFINSGASYEDIELAKHSMKDVLKKELIYMMEIQLFFTLGAIILGLKFLPMIGFTTEMIHLFNIMCLGYYCSMLMFIVITILLYFEDRKGACLCAIVFCLVNFGATLLTVGLGESYYGLGLFIAGLSALIFALLRLEYFIQNIDYYIFCKHASWSKS